jgi:fatty acid desaturase
MACLSFSFFTVQLAGIMHDGGHRAIFRSRHLNDALGFVAAASIGMILYNWRTHHNRHHAYPNEEGKDPDIEIPLVSLNETQLARKRGLSKLLSRYQALYFYVIVATASFSNRIGGASFFFKPQNRGDILNLVAYLPVVFAVFVGPFLLFPLDKAIFVFLLVHLSSGFYLANCFAPNHKGMTMLEEDAEYSFIEQQVITARNVRGGFLTDLLLVGLNYQIEHHLFPNCPRNKLAQIKPLVEKTCAKHSIPYEETGAVESMRRIVRSVNAVPNR